MIKTILVAQDDKYAGKLLILRGNGWFGLAILLSWDPVGEVDPEYDGLHALDGQALLHHALHHTQGVRGGG